MPTGFQKPLSIDEVDFSSIKIPHTRFILLPVSESAAYSTQLPENDDHVLYISGHLLSPENSSSEDGHAAEHSVKISRRKRARKQSAIFFQQSRNRERVTFGASQNNDVILKHPDALAPDGCYINLCHAQIYPQPDGSAFEIFNCSTSTFHIDGKDVFPDQNAILDTGSWYISFGQRMSF